MTGARNSSRQCLAIARSIEHRELESECERNLGELALKAENLQAARARFTRSLKICQDAQDKRGEAITLWRLGKTDAACGDHDLARKRLSEALLALQAFEMNSELLDCLEDYASLLGATGHTETCIRIYAAAASVRNTLGLPRSARREDEMQSRVKAARAELGERAFEAAWLMGRIWSRDEAIEHALASAAVSADRVTARCASPAKPAGTPEGTLTAAEAMRAPSHSSVAETWLRRSVFAVSCSVPSPITSMHFICWGWLRPRRGRLEEADRLLTRALGTHRESAEAHSNHGNMQRARGIWPRRCRVTTERCR